MGNSPSVEDGDRGLPHRLSKRPHRRGPEQPPPPETFDYSDRYKSLASNTSLGTTVVSGYTSAATYPTKAVPDIRDQLAHIHKSVARQDTLDTFSQHHARLTPHASNDSLRKNHTGVKSIGISPLNDPGNEFRETNQSHGYYRMPGDQETQLPAAFEPLRPEQKSRPDLHRAKTAPSSRPLSLPATRQLPWDATSTVDYNLITEPVSRPLLEARVRRRSLNQVPGVATRMEMIKPIGDSRHGQSGHSITVVDVQKPRATRRASMPLVALNNTESPVRAVTPSEADYRGLGTNKFGSLHITNRTRTPSPTPTSESRLTSRFSISELQPALPQAASKPKSALLMNMESEPTMPSRSVSSQSTKYESPPESSRNERIQGPSNEYFPRQEILFASSSSEQSTPQPDVSLVPHPDSGYSSAISIQDKENLLLFEANTQHDDTYLVASQTSSKESEKSQTEQHNAVAVPGYGPRPDSETNLLDERLPRGSTLATLSKRLPSLKRSKSRGSASVKSSTHSRNLSTETDASVSTSSMYWPFNRRRKSLPNVHKVDDTIDPVPPIPKDIEDRIRAGKIPRASHVGYGTPQLNRGRSESGMAWRSSRTLLAPSKAHSTILKNRDSGPLETQSQWRSSAVPSGKSWMWNQELHTVADLGTGLEDDYMADAVIDESQIYELETTQLSAGNSAFDQALKAMNRPTPTGPVKQPPRPYRPQSMRSHTQPLRHRSSAPDLQHDRLAPLSPSALNVGYVPGNKSSPPVSMHSQRVRNTRAPSPAGPHMSPRRSLSQSGPSPGVTPSTYLHVGVPSPPHGQRSPRRPASQQQGFFEPRREMASLPLWQQSQVIPEYGTRQHFRSHTPNTEPRTRLHSQDDRAMNRRPSKRRSLMRPHQSTFEPRRPLRSPPLSNPPAYGASGVHTEGE